MPSSSRVCTRAAGSHAPAWPSVYFQLRDSSSSGSKPAEQPKIADPAARRTPPTYHESLPSVSSAT